MEIQNTVHIQALDGATHALTVSPGALVADLKRELPKRGALLLRRILEVSTQAAMIHRRGSLATAAH